MTELLPNYERFPYNICYGCGMPTRNAYSSGHLVPSPLGYVLVIEADLFPEPDVIFPDYALRTSLGTFLILRSK